MGYNLWKLWIIMLYILNLSNIVCQHWPQDWKRSVFIPISKKGNAKECSNNRTIALISHTSKVMLKILQARLQQYENRGLPDFKLVLEKTEDPEVKLPTSAGSWKKQESSRKHLFLLYWLCQSLWLCGSQQTKFLNRWEYQTIWYASGEICMQVRKQPLELDMAQQTGSK